MARRGRGDARTTGQSARILVTVAGHPVDEEFEYNSARNPHFLRTEEILALNELAGY